MYTVWRLSYIKNDDPFTRRLRTPKAKANRRRSSMQPGLASGGNDSSPSKSSGKCRGHASGQKDPEDPQGRPIAREGVVS